MLSCSLRLLNRLNGVPWIHSSMVDWGFYHLLISGKCSPPNVPSIGGIRSNTYTENLDAASLRMPASLRRRCMWPLCSKKLAKHGQQLTAECSEACHRHGIRQLCQPCQPEGLGQCLLVSKIASRNSILLLMFLSCIHSSGL